MSVNVSTRQLADPNLPRDVRAAVEAAGIDPTRLTLEITEHLLLDDGELMQQRLRALKEIGVHLAIDDFGTGYSALSYLQTFPIDVLKIDRSFVSGIDRDPERARLVRSIVEIGHNLHLSVVSEGIEETGRSRTDARVPLPVRPGLPLLQAGRRRHAATTFSPTTRH